MKIIGFDWDAGNWPNAASMVFPVTRSNACFLTGKPESLLISSTQPILKVAIWQWVAWTAKQCLWPLPYVTDEFDRSVLGTCTPERSLDMKKIPKFRTDKEAEAFLEQDLSQLDFKQFKPMPFEIEPKAAALNMRLPASLLEAIKAKARSQGIPYTRYVRMVLENDVSRRP